MKIDLNNVTIEDVKKLVVFSVLMETWEGILGKHPSYIIEKLGSAWNNPRPENLLDADNKEKYEKWIRRWIN